MPIYTSDPGQGINQPITNAPASLGDALEASFDSGFREGPLISAMRFSEADSLANDPNSKIVPKADADAQLKALGVRSINVPDTGVTQSYLDHVTESRKESLAKQQIAQSAPSGFINTPLNFMAGLAGSMADPANLAIGLVPFAGEARAATLLGRAGERLLQGAAMGAGQTALTLPFTATAAAAEGDDYTMASAMENMFMGTVGGGVLHAGGGVISDLIRGIKPRESGRGASEQSSAVASPEVVDPFVDTPAYQRAGSDIDLTDMRERRSQSFRDGGELSGTTPILAQAISSDLDNYAYSKAYDDVLPQYLSDREASQSGRIGNVDDLRNEIAVNEQAIARLDGEVSQRTSDYQSNNRMKFKEAQRRALKDVSSEKDALSARNKELNDSLRGNKQAEVSRAESSAASRGEMPESLKAAVEARAQEIKSGMQVNPISKGIKNASQRINDAHWTVRQNAFRAGLSHMLQGKSPDIEPLFTLADPQMREASMSQIQQGPRSEADSATINSSSEANSQYQRAARENSDLINAQEDLNSEFELAQNMVNDLDSPELRNALESARKEVNDDSLLKGMQAYATCMLRRM
ncbi:hypothetical protein [Rahnella bonaserana]